MCGNCKHYKPCRNPDTGRILPSQAGVCAYPVKWPELPQAYHYASWPYPHHVWVGSCPDCKMFGSKS